jgi:hypothetical protein
MAFCRNCGGEVSTDAYVCIKCGSLINPGIKKTIKSNESVLEFHRTATFWLLFAGGICFFISLFWFILSIWGAYISVDTSYSTIYNSIYSYGYFYLVHDYLISALVFSIFTFLTILASFITSYNAVKNELCSKAFTFTTLFLMIGAAIYLLAMIVCTS